MRSLFSKMGRAFYFGVLMLAISMPAGAMAGQTNESGLFNVSLLALGATAKGSGSKFNKDWPPNSTLITGLGRGGTMFGGPLKGGRVDIRMVVPVDIKAIADLAGWQEGA